MHSLEYTIGHCYKELTLFSYISQQILLVNCRTTLSTDVRRHQLIPELNVDFCYSTLGMLEVASVWRFEVGGPPPQISIPQPPLEFQALNAVPESTDDA